MNRPEHHQYETSAIDLEQHGRSMAAANKSANAVLDTAQEIGRLYRRLSSGIIVSEEDLRTLYALNAQAVDAVQAQAAPIVEQENRLSAQLAGKPLPTSSPLRYTLPSISDI